MTGDQVSPAMRELLEAASGPDYARWSALARGVHGCTHPVRLAGRSLDVDRETGEVVQDYRTADEPTGYLLTRCGNRRATVCESCAEVYRADTFHLIRAGLAGGKGVPESVRDHLRVFATLTAPSFGLVHSTRERDGRTLPCRPRRHRPDCAHGRPAWCSGRHERGDPHIGQPLCLDCFDYVGAVLWNAHVGQLWSRFSVYLRRRLAAHRGVSRAALGHELRVSFAKVVEYQARGLIHVHALVRLDGPEGPADPAPSWATEALRSDAIQEAAALVMVPGPLGQTLRWGDQLDVRSLPVATGEDAEGDRVAGYVAKYATKGAEVAGTVDHRIRRLSDLDRFRLPDHTRRFITTCWELGARPDLQSLRLRGMGAHARSPRPLLHEEPPLLDHAHRPAPGPSRRTQYRRPGGPRPPFTRRPTHRADRRVAVRRNRLQPRARSPGWPAAWLKPSLRSQGAACRRRTATRNAALPNAARGLTAVLAPGRVGASAPARGSPGLRERPRGRCPRTPGPLRRGAERRTKRSPRPGHPEGYTAGRATASLCPSPYLRAIYGGGPPVGVGTSLPDPRGAPLLHTVILRAHRIFDVRVRMTAKPLRERGPHALAIVMSNLAGLLAIVGILTYAILLVSYDLFYSHLGIRPEDVGLDRITILGQSAGLYIIAVPIALVELFVTQWQTKSPQLRHSGGNNELVKASGLIAIISYRERLSLEDEYRKRVSFNRGDGFKLVAILALVAVNVYNFTHSHIKGEAIEDTIGAITGGIVAVALLAAPSVLRRHGLTEQARRTLVGALISVTVIVPTLVITASQAVHDAGRVKRGLSVQSPNFFGVPILAYSARPTSFEWVGAASAKEPSSLRTSSNSGGASLLLLGSSSGTTVLYKFSRGHGSVIRIPSIDVELEAN